MGKKRLEKFLKRAAFWTGGKLRELDKDTVEQILVFLVDVIVVAVKFTPNPMDDVAATILAPSLKKLIDRIDGEEG